MKTLLTISFICLFSFGFNILSNGQNISNPQKVKIEKQVDSAFSAMVQLGEKLDYNKLSIGVDDSNHAGFIVNNTYYTTYDSLLNILKANLPSGAKQRISFQHKKITVLSENIALVTASGTANVELGTGQSFNVNFQWSFVYQKIGNNWKVVQSHQSQAN